MKDIETALEMRYKSLKMEKFPLKYNNLFNGIGFNEEISLGVTDLKIENLKFRNSFCKIYKNSNLILLDIVGKEFKLGLELKKITKRDLVSTGNILYYEMEENLSRERFLEVLEFLKKLFAGEIINLKFSKFKIKLQISNPIEIMKIKLTEELFENSHLKVEELKGSFYEVFLMTKSEGKESLNTWVNFNLENYENYSQENLELSRIYKMEIQGQEYNLIEKIKLEEPLTKEKVLEVQGKIRREKAIIELETVEMGK
ncbi:MAG: hypothetical protein MJH09_07430 [Cetobacterium sp.]|nr:hypothetical protein [Cetobacterium sp.]